MCEYKKIGKLEAIIQVPTQLTNLVSSSSTTAAHQSKCSRVAGWLASWLAIVGSHPNKLS